MPGVPTAVAVPTLPILGGNAEVGGAQEVCGSLLSSTFPAEVVGSASLPLKGEKKAQSHSPKGKSEIDQEIHVLKVSHCLFHLYRQKARQA